MPAPGPVWLVEESGTRRVYSNGLIVRADYATESSARSYRTYSRTGLRAGEPAAAPAGIVFHTTESLMVPLTPALRQALQVSREDVLAHVRRDRLYNFVIDRFGQVYGVVPEGQVAFHAGHSVWAEGDHVFLDLNESFLGVSFEAQTDSEFHPSAAQVHSGRLVTEMLRSRFSIPEANCVTHAQVSVNPDNMRLGYHTDWGSAFPFRELGLGAGYGATVAAVRVFGFVYDDAFLAAIGGQAWEGLTAAEKEMAGEAAARGLAPSDYRKILQEQYRQLRRQRNERAG